MSQRWSVLSTALVILCLPLSVQGQTGTLAGVVSDAESGLGLQDAAIEVLGTGDAQAGGVFSDASGSFSLSVTAGSYSLVISLLGYETVRVDGVTVEAGGTVAVPVQLSSTAFLLNPIIVSASRRAEKALEAPARVEIIGQEKIQERAATSAVEHVKGIPGVDIAQSGLSQSSVVARGFNNIFSGALLVLTDNRYGRVPSIRVNAWNFIPLNNLDLERMEVVLGPGAALYGPNSASGVLHMITRSPIDAPGNTVALAGGERSVFQGQFRSAWANETETFGFKLSGQYFQGNDWEFEDPVEQSARADVVAAGGDPGRIGLRDYDQQRYSLDARADFRPSDDTELIFNGGFNKSLSSVELTGIGAGQADGWTYNYFQSRFTKDRLFAQFFLNGSNAGDTYLLRTGQPIIDKSKFYAAQVQHGITLGDDTQEFIYGLDLQWTRPNTEGSINGMNEDDDAINEIGGYIHSETALSDKFDLVAALRVDSHSELDDPVFSPRAALVFRPDENQNFRLTFNRAFSTPTSNNLFLDILAGQIPLGGGLGYDIRARGTPSSGFTFTDQCPGGLNNLCMRSPFQSGQLPALGSAFFNNLAPTVIGLLLQQAQVDPQLQALIPLLQNPSVAGLLAGGNPIGSIESVLRRLNTEDQTFGADPGPMRIDRLKPTTYNTFELGYKGLLGGRFLVAADFYRTKVNDFVGPLRVETPMLFLDPATTGAYIAQQLAPLGATLPAAAVQGLVTALTTAYAQIPLGTVVPDQFDDSTVLVAYRNFGDVSYWGADLSAQMLVSERVSLTASYSRVSKDCFDANDDGTTDCSANLDIALNASKNKGSLGIRFDDERSGITLDGKARFQAEFPMNSGVYVGTVDGYTLFDANISYQLPFYPGATVGITGNNLFDNMHREFVGAPLLGRLLLTRVQIDF